MPTLSWNARSFSSRSVASSFSWLARLASSSTNAALASKRSTSCCKTWQGVFTEKRKEVKNVCFVKNLAVCWNKPEQKQWPKHVTHETTGGCINSFRNTHAYKNRNVWVYRRAEKRSFAKSTTYLQLLKIIEGFCVLCCLAEMWGGCIEIPVCVWLTPNPGVVYLARAHLGERALPMHLVCSPWATKTKTAA